MVYRINKKKYENLIIYSSDNKSDIVRKISYHIKSLPKYVNITNIEDFDRRDKNFNFNVQDLFNSSLKDSFKSFPKFYNNNKKYFDLEDIVKLWWISTGSELDDLYIQDILVYDLKAELNKLGLELELDLDSDKEDQINEIKNKISLFMENEKGNMNLEKKFQKLKKIKHTPFKKEKTSIEIRMSLEKDKSDIDILEIFDAFHISDKIPFISANNFYKIYKDFIPPKEWAFSQEGIIILQILNKDEIDLENVLENENIIEKIFSESFIYIEDSSKNLVIEINEDKDTHFQDILSIISSSLKLNLTKISETPTTIGGVYFYPQRSFNKYILADLVMNNPIFNFLKIDESNKASKSKSSVYVYFNSSREDLVTATITGQIVEKNSELLKNNDFNINDDYIRVKISRAKNMEDVKEFINTFSKLLSEYYKEENKIIKEYRKFIPNFGDDKITKRKSEKIRLKDIAPDLFIEGYTRKCLNPPTIIQEKDVKKYKKQGLQVLKFPKSEKEGKQHYYICLDKKKPYPGLRPNTLGNMDIYPYFPCCYPVDHMKRENSKYNKYMKGIKEEEDIKAQRQRIFKSYKIIPGDDYGVLPQNIEKLLSSIDDKIEYLRKGVDFNISKRSKNSFLYCLEESMNSEIFLEENEANLENYIREIRLNLLSEINPSICKQEFFNMNSDEISNYIMDLNNYFDPKLFVTLLEEYYDCNIFIFGREKNSTEGKLIIPNHTQTYYVYSKSPISFKNKEYRKTVLVYEHWGSESDRSQFPQCELIIGWDKSGKTVDTFSYDDKISTEVKILFNNVNRTYNLNRLVNDIDLPYYLSHNIKGQFIDNYGKCRIIKVEFNGETIFLHTDPIPPLNTDEIPRKKCSKKVNTDIAIEFLNFIGINIIGQTVIGGKCIELMGSFGKEFNVNVYLSIDKGNPIEGIPINSDINIIFSKSHLNNYNKNKRLSRYMVEYLYYLFSHFIRNEDIKGEPSIENIHKFFDSKTIIIEDFKYEKVPRKFSLKSGVMHEKKLVFTSESTLKRFVYVLRLVIERNYERIIGYYNRKNIDEYFVDITDFKKYPNQIILEGEDSVDDLISEKNRNYILYRGINTEEEAPYFIKNKIMTNNEVFLAQNTSSLNNSLGVSEIWDTEGYNTLSQNTSEDFPFTLYSYINSKKIVPYGDDSDIKIVGYLRNGTPKFTSLLDLNRSGKKYEGGNIVEL